MIIDYNWLTVLTVFYCQSVTIEALLCASVSTNRPVWFSMDLCFNTGRWCLPKPYFSFSPTVSKTWTWINHLSTSTSVWSYIVASMLFMLFYDKNFNKNLHLVLNKKEILLLENFSDYNRFTKFHPIIDRSHINERFWIVIDHRNNTRPSS